MVRRLIILSRVPVPGRKPRCSLLTSLSILLAILCCIILRSSLVTWLIKLIVLNSVQIIALDFLGRVINTECFISVGIIPLLYIMLQSDVIISILCSYSAFSASAGNSSVPVAFPSSIDFNAFCISSFIMLAPLVTSNLGICSLWSSYSSVIYSTHLAAISSWLNNIFPFLSFMHPLAFFFVFLDVSSFNLLCISLDLYCFSKCSTSSHWLTSHFSLASLHAKFICLFSLLYSSVHMNSCTFTDAALCTECLAPNTPLTLSHMVYHFACHTRPVKTFTYLTQCMPHVPDLVMT